ncbi:MAG: hypothetical protein ABSB82_17925 [Terriglobia bacterium]
MNWDEVIRACVVCHGEDVMLQNVQEDIRVGRWIPAFAGMTDASRFGHWSANLVGSDTMTGEPSAAWKKSKRSFRQVTRL